MRILALRPQWAAHLCNGLHGLYGSVRPGLGSQSAVYFLRYATQMPSTSVERQRSERYKKPGGTGTSSMGTADSTAGATIRAGRSDDDRCKLDSRPFQRLEFANQMSVSGC